jgi:hypothetical protein
MQVHSGPRSLRTPRPHWWRPRCSASPTWTSTRATPAVRTCGRRHHPRIAHLGPGLDRPVAQAAAAHPEGAQPPRRRRPHHQPGPGPRRPGCRPEQLISSAAGTIQLLANKGDDLGQLNGTLAQLTGTLDSDTSQIEQLVQEYDTVSTVIAQHSGQLNDAITNFRAPPRRWSPADAEPAAAGSRRGHGDHGWANA